MSAASVSAVVVAVEVDAHVAIVSRVASSLMLSLSSARPRFDALLWSPYGIGQSGRPLYFHPSFVLLCSSFFTSSPNLSRCRLDVCHTATHGARGSLKTQDAKKSPKIAIWASSHNFVGLYLRNYGTYRQSEKNWLSSNMFCTCLHNMVNFGPLAAEIGPVV